MGRPTPTAGVQFGLVAHVAPWMRAFSVADDQGYEFNSTVRDPYFGGDHGYDNAGTDMQAILVAAGPDVREGIRLSGTLRRSCGHMGVTVALWHLHPRSTQSRYMRIVPFFQRSSRWMCTTFWLRSSACSQSPMKGRWTRPCGAMASGGKPPAPASWAGRRSVA